MLSAPGARRWKRLVLVVSAVMVIVAMALPARAVSLTQAWAERYVGGTDFQYAKSLAVSPDGGTVYVTGISAGPEQEGDPYDVFATIAYDTANGDMRWIDRYAFADGDNWASTIVVTPNGQKLFVTGATPDGYPIVAYDAASGHRLWVKSVATAGYVGFAGTLATSPDSRLVYFTGEVQIGDGPSTRARDTRLRRRDRREGVGSEARCARRIAGGTVCDDRRPAGFAPVRRWIHRDALAVPQRQPARLPHRRLPRNPRAVTCGRGPTMARRRAAMRRKRSP